MPCLREPDNNPLDIHPLTYSKDIYYYAISKNS